MKFAGLPALRAPVSPTPGPSATVLATEMGPAVTAVLTYPFSTTSTPRTVTLRSKFPTLVETYTVSNASFLGSYSTSLVKDSPGGEPAKATCNVSASPKAEGESSLCLVTLPALFPY